MSITVTGGGLPANVVEIGNEVTQGIVDGLNYASPAASSSNVFATASNIPAIATIAQSEALLSDTVVVSPLDLRYAMFNVSFYKPIVSTFVLSTLGTGGLNDTLWDMRRLQGPTSASNTYVRAEVAQRSYKGRSFNENTNWTKPQAVTFRVIISSTSADVNSTFIASLGEVTASNIGDPTTRSIGVKYSTGGGLTLLAHDGTTLTVPAGSFTPVSNQAFDVLMTSDGLGTINYYVNNSLIGTTTLGPKTLLAGFNQQNNLNLRVYNTSTPSGTQLSIYVMGFAIHNGN